ncbi:hypothetical protein [Pantoea sp. S18]|uniref:hypothetical protein n=1 Tax=Pantoea sp. S18 TaxID=3019892 RepID=UPI002B21BAED|nr:hypothetical protein [Pantoea sp. S18]MEA5104461.1 hypothetical protein [Pantoea sp. S18]
MTDDEFKEQYPPSQFDYVRTGKRTKGHMGQTEIEYYNIIDKSTGKIVRNAIYTEHTNVRGLDSSEYWD